MNMIKFLKSRKYAITTVILLVILGILFYTDRLPDTTSGSDYTVKVVGISDGDSFTGLTKDNQQIRYRIFGIDAPEKSQPFSNEARKLLSDLIYRKKVNLILVEPSDNYSREVVRVFIADSIDVGAEMIKNGLAWHYRHFDVSSNYFQYEQLEQQARENKIGLWSLPNAENPSKFRKEHRQKQPTTYQH